MDTERTEHFCFICRAPGERPSAADEPYCLTAEPADVRGDPFDSIMIMGLRESEAYRVSYAGQQVTTQTIAAMCGGQAPFLWRTKHVEVFRIAPSQPMTEEIFGGILGTIDGALYSWGHLAGNGGTLTYAQERASVAIEMIAYHSLIDALTLAVRLWMATNEDPCTDESLYPSMCGPDMGVPLAEAGRSCPGGGTLSSEESLLVDALSLELNEASFPGGEAHVPIAYCPVPYANNNVGAAFDLLNNSIAVFPGVYEMARQAEDPSTVLRYVLAHELGHARHDLAAGTGQTEDFFIGVRMGLPTRVALALQAAGRELDVPAGCVQAFAESLRDVAGLDVDDWISGESQRFGGELIAELYAYDQVVLDPLHPLSSHDLSLLLEHVRGYARWTDTALTSIFTAFPDGVRELVTLYWTIAFDPQLQPLTKQHGLRVLLDIARALPPEAQRYLIAGDPPLRCGIPSVLAAFPEAASLFLQEGEWCDIFDYELHEPPGTLAEVPIPQDILQMEER